jgi:peptidoglycan/xylan/chitin deacetylase (PgdA/CDA1 family)
MLLSLLYHHVNSDYLSNSPELVEEHVKYISKHFKTLFPSEYKPSIFSIQLCLIIDDGYYDFYHYTYQLLKKYNVKAILAVPCNFILDSTNVESKVRLGLKHSEIMKGDNFKKYAPFCTWEELKEMSDSGLVKIASHGLKHIRLTEASDQEVDEELSLSKKIIESKIETNCDCFVYPYTAFDDKIIQKTLIHYDYSFGYGGIMNYKIRNGFMNRVLGDEMSSADALFTTRKILGYYKRTIKSEFLKGILKK